MDTSINAKNASMEEQGVFHLFGHLAPDIRVRLSELLRVRTFTTSERVFVQDAPTSAIYVVASGRVKIARVTDMGDEVILCVREPGEYFCPVTVLDGNAQLGAAIAMTDVTLMWAERRAFLALCKEHPALLSVVQSACLLEVRHLVHRLEARSFRSVKERLAHTLLTENRRKSNGDAPTDAVRLTQQELGDLIGASRESVSRTLAQFEREGLVGLRRGQVLLKDLERLAQLANQDEM
nr:Crp/Fnr family transcriptional regulator [Chloroflexota bacterium]